MESTKSEVAPERPVPAPDDPAAVVRGHTPSAGRAAISAGTERLRNWQRATIALMACGYAGYYFCRSNLSVCTPLIIRDEHVSKVFIGGFISLGTLLYAIGKFVSGSTADYVGGRRMFLTGMGGAIFCTVLFATGGVPVFTLAWVLNRAVQSAGWVGMVKISSRWFSYSVYGAVMGVISLSYLFGDFASRVFLGQLITWGLGWRGVFYCAAGVLLVLLIANALALHETPRDLGLPEPSANPDNVFGAAGHASQPETLRSLLAPLLRSGLFWTVCALSVGFTFLRETFNNWTPEYLTSVVGLSPGAAAQASSLFPLFGGLSVLAAGYASDRLGSGGRAALIFFGLLVTIPPLLVFAMADLRGATVLALVAIGAVGFVMIGPYSFLAGAVSLDFGGKRGSATACGWIDGMGYVGGVLAGEGVAKLAQGYGWNSAFLALAVVAAVSCMAAAAYWRMMVRTVPSGTMGATG